MKGKLILLTCFMVLLAGCTEESTGREVNGFTSPAKDREVIAYAADGSVIDKWEGHYALSIQGSTVVLKNKRKEIIISGTWISKDK